MVGEQNLIVDDRFEIERLVAHGGMGSIYRAFDRVEGQPVALKLMGTLLGESEDARFTREAGLLARLHHPRIVRYLGHGRTSEGRPFLVMQWLEGEDLRTALDRGRLSLPDALCVLKGAAEAVAAVHAMGIIHRDLKPGNLFLRGGSVADLVLLDFGLARPVEPTLRLTASGALLGTPYYMAPEQATSGQALQTATDIFSLGSIFYECLAGKPPFYASHVASVLAKILFNPEVPIQTLRPSVPRAWAELLARMLSKEPARRPSDARELCGEIARLPLVTAEVERAETAPGSHALASHEEGREQTLACVMLVMFPYGTSPDAETREIIGMSERYDATRSALVRFGFAVEWLADTSLIATLSSSGAATDQARIAARGALYAREVWPEARIALATGRALLGRARCMGEAVDRAARLLERPDEPAGAPQDTEGVWIDTVTAGLLDAHFVTVPLGSNVLLYAERPDADEGRLLLGKPTPCIGREIELAQLEGLMSRAVADAAAEAALIVAPPGTGKSRLRHELLRRLKDKYPEAEILVGHGDPLTVGSPYGLVGDALRRLAGIRVGTDPVQAQGALAARLCRYVAPEDARRVGEFLGELCGILSPAVDSPPLQAARSDPRVMSEQITQAFMDWIAAECTAHPVVLVLEDLQWGDALTVNLMEATLRDRGDAPLLVLVLGRPEIRDVFPGLLSERAQEMALRPLSRRASEALIKGALGDSLDPEALARMVELAGGNALFLEELIRTAAEGKAGDVPETVLAMLQTRIARLPPEARRVLRAASLFGEAFWPGPVQRLVESWGAIGDVAPWLGHLGEAEFVQRHRESRFSAEIEYGFRHALVRDAAYSLLTGADRRSGHVLAGHWLEAMGDTDAMALAGHAQEGGDAERAISFYTRAAEQSLGRNDLKEALTRAIKGVDGGAEGDALGVLRSIQAVALYGLGDWPRCASVGLSALELLPSGSVWWCRAAEKLFHVLPQVQESQRAEALSDEILRTEPAPEARSAYVYALCSLVGGFTLIGRRDRARSCLELVDGIGSASFDTDLYARGTALMWHSYSVMVLEPDPYLACSLAEQSARAFAEGQVLHQLCLVRTLVGFERMELGDAAGAEESTRSALSVAERLGDGYMLTNARFYLAYVLTESPDPAKLDEAKHLAQRVLEANISVSYQSCAYWAFANLALMRGQWATAEAEARRARERSAFSPIYVIAASTCLLRGLMGQGRVEEAVAVAREELDRLSRLEGAGFSEVPFRAAAAEALFQAGEREDAEESLREALHQIDLRASRIPDAAVKDSYLHRNKDNRRVFELARAWFGERPG